MKSELLGFESRETSEAMSRHRVRIPALA